MSKSRFFNTLEWKQSVGGGRAEEGENRREEEYGRREGERGRGRREEGGQGGERREDRRWEMREELEGKSANV